MSLLPLWIVDGDYGQYGELEVLHVLEDYRPEIECVIRPYQLMAVLLVRVVLMKHKPATIISSAQVMNFIHTQL